MVVTTTFVYHLLRGDEYVAGRVATEAAEQALFIEADAASSATKPGIVGS